MLEEIPLNEIRKIRFQKKEDIRQPKQITTSHPSFLKVILEYAMMNAS